MAKRSIDDKINDEGPEDRCTFQRATDEVLKTRVIKKAVRRNKKGGGFLKGADVKESPSSFLSKDRTEPGTSMRSGAASNFTLSSIYSETTDSVGASIGPVSGLKAFANSATAGKSPFSFLSGNNNASDAKEKFTFRPPIAVAHRLEAENENSSNFLTKQKKLNESLAKLLITQSDENPARDLTPLFNHYLNNLKNMEKGGGDKGTVVEESPLSFLSKEPTKPGTSMRSGAAANFVLSSINTESTDNLGASIGPVSGLKAFANSATAGKSPFSFLSGNNNASDAKEKFTFRPPIAVAHRLEAENENSSNFLTKQKKLNESLAKLLITQSDENPARDLTPLFNLYLNNLKNMEKGGGDKGTVVEESPLSFLSKDPTEPGTSMRSGAAANFVLSSINRETTDNVGASIGPFSGLKAFANSATAGKSPFSFLSGNSNASDAKEKFTFRSPIAVAHRLEAENGNSSNYLTKQKKLNESLAKLLITQIDENPARDLTPLFNHYLNNLKDMEKGGGDKGFPTATIVEESPFSFLSKEPTDQGTGERSAAALPFSGLKAFANSTTAQKSPSSILSETINASDGKENFTFRSPVTVAQKAEAEDEKSSSYVTKQKILNQLTKMLITQIDENSGRDLTPLFNHYLNYVKEMDKGEDKLEKLVSEGAEKFPLMVMQSSGFTFPTNPFSDWTTSSQRSGDKPTSCSTSTSSAAATTYLPICTVGSFGSSALISADNPSILGGTAKSSEQATEKNDFNFALKSNQNNTTSSLPKFTLGSFGTTALNSVDKTRVSMMNAEIDEEPEDIGTFQRATEEVLKTRVLKKAVRRSKKGTGDTDAIGFLKTTTGEKSPLSFLSKEPTEPGTSMRSGAASNFALSSIYSETTDSVGASIGPFSGLKAFAKELTEPGNCKRSGAASNITFGSTNTECTDDVGESKGSFKGFKGFANSTAAGKHPCLFLSGTSNASGAKEEFTFRSLISTAEKAEAENENLNSYVITKQKHLKQSLSELFKPQIDENPGRDLTPHFNHYVNYLKEMDKGEDGLEKSVSKGSQKVSLMGTPSSAFTFPAKPFSTISSDAGTTSSESSPDKPTFCNTSATSAASNTTLPEFTVGSFSTSALISADKAKLFEGATPSSSKATQTNAFSFDLMPVETNRTTNPSSRTTGSCFFGVKVEENSNSTPPTFGGNISRSVNNKKSKEKSADLSFTPASDPFILKGVKSPVQTESLENLDGDGKEFNQALLKFSLYQINNANLKINYFLKKNAVYPKVCKVYIKTDGKYADHGVGTLYLKALKVSGKTKLLVRAVTDQGNVLMNFVLRKQILMQRVGKHNVLMVAVSSPSNPIVLRFKTSKDADEVLNTLEKYKK